jgi:hypothetical protein
VVEGVALWYALSRLVASGANVFFGLVEGVRVYRHKRAHQFSAETRMEAIEEGPRFVKDVLKEGIHRLVAWRVTCDFVL